MICSRSKGAPIKLLSQQKAGDPTCNVILVPIQAIALLLSVEQLQIRMAWVAALTAFITRTLPCTPVDLWAHTPLVHQEAILTFLVGNPELWVAALTAGPWVAALKAREDLDCGTASAEGCNLLLELCAGWHSGLLLVGLGAQVLQLEIWRCP